MTEASKEVVAASEGKKREPTWKDLELRAVSKAIYRQFKYEFEHHHSGLSPHQRMLTEADIKFAQVVANLDESRQKSAFGRPIMQTLSRLIINIHLDEAEAKKAELGVLAASEETSIRTETAPPSMKLDHGEPIKSSLQMPSIDHQIRTIVRSELATQQTSLLLRIDELLKSHERSISFMMEQQERRLIEFWSGPNSDNPAETAEQEPAKPKARKLRVLVEALRSDQHRLITDRLKRVSDIVDVVIHSQDDSMVGVKAEYFDKVVVLTGFIGHARFAKIQSIFSKAQIHLCNGAALSAAHAILEMVERKRGVIEQD